MKAAQKAAFDAQDDQAVVVKSKMVGGIAQVSQKHPLFLELYFSLLSDVVSVH